MKKTFKLSSLDCANCAAKMEREASKVDGVNKVTFNFMMQKMTLDCEEENLDEILEKLQKICEKVEAGCKIII